jgi:hypothetical protein
MLVRTKAHLFVIVLSVLLGCASSIVEGEHIRTSSISLPSKPPEAAIEIYFADSSPHREYSKVGKVSSRAYVLEKGIEELKEQARLVGADAVVDVNYERRMSADYFLDLFFITGNAIIWEE